MKIVLDIENKQSRFEREKTISVEKILKREIENKDSKKYGYLNTFKSEYLGDFDSEVLPNIKTLEVNTIEDASNQFKEIMGLVMSNNDIRKKLSPIYLTEISRNRTTILRNADLILLQKLTYQLDTNEKKNKEDIITSLENMDDGSIFKSVVDNGDDTISVYSSVFGIWKHYDYEKIDGKFEKLLKYNTRRIFDNSNEGIKRNFQVKKLTDVYDSTDTGRLNYSVYNTIYNLYKNELIGNFSKLVQYTDLTWNEEKAEYNIQPIHVCVPDNPTTEDFENENIRIEELKKIQTSVSHVNKPTPSKKGTNELVESNKDKVRSVYLDTNSIINEVKNEINESNTKSVENEEEVLKTEEEVLKTEDEVCEDKTTTEDEKETNESNEKVEHKQDSVSVENISSNDIVIDVEVSNDEDYELDLENTAKEVEEPKIKVSEVIKNKVDKKLENIDKLVEEKLVEQKETNIQSYYEKLNNDLLEKFKREQIELQEKIKKAEISYRKKYEEFVTALENGNDFETAMNSINFKLTDIEQKRITEEVKQELLLSKAKDEIIKEEKFQLNNAFKRIERQNISLTEREVAINGLRSEKEELIKDVQELNEINTELIDVKDGLEQAITSYKMEINDLNEEIEKKDTEYQELENELDEIYEYKSKFEQISPLFEETKVVVVKLDKENTELKKDNESLKSSNDDLLRKVAELEKQLESKDSQINDLSRDNKVLSESNTELKKDKDNLQTTLNKTFDNLEKTSKRNEDLIDRLEKDTKLFNGKYEEQLNRIKSLEKEIENLREGKTIPERLDELDSKQKDTASLNEVKYQKEDKSNKHNKEDKTSKSSKQK